MTSTLPNDNIRNFDDQITNKLISEIIRDRIKNSGTRFSANDNIADFINPGELEILEREVASRVKDLLKSIIIDVENDHNTQETAERVSKMYLNEVFKGRYHQQPKVIVQALIELDLSSSLKHLVNIASADFEIQYAPHWGKAL